jgi:sulfur carrier protein ThiS
LFESREAAQPSAEDPEPLPSLGLLSDNTAAVALSNSLVAARIEGKIVPATRHKTLARSSDDRAVLTVVVAVRTLDDTKRLRAALLHTPVKIDNKQYSSVKDAVSARSQGTNYSVRDKKPVLHSAAAESGFLWLNALAQRE